MRAVALLLAVVALAACQTTSSVAGHSPTPRDSGPYAVMVHTAGLGEPYYVQLVGQDARGGPWARATTRSAKTLYAKWPCMAGPDCEELRTAPYSMPETSASRTRVYFLDGDTRVMAIDTAGKVSTVTNIQAPPNSQVMFAVSPDDSRIAVSIVTLATSFQATGPFDDTMYVADLRNGADRVELYHSTEIAKWPIGWWQDRSVIVADGTQDLAVDDNAYGAAGYEVVDSANGAVRARLDCSSRGLVVAAGTACSTGFCTTPTYCQAGRLFAQAWDGATMDFAVPAAAQKIFLPYSNLSPAGDKMAVSVVTDEQTGSLETAVLDKSGDILYRSLTGAPQGWLDESHLVLGSIDGVLIADITSGRVVPISDLQRIPQQGQPHLIATLPPSL